MYKNHLNHPDFEEIIEADLLIVGGGVAGTAAALAAAREGVRTVLIQNRPVMGGVSSIEYGEGDGACVNGAYNYSHRNARECGIIEELKNENAWRNENGYRTCWSLVLREAVERLRAASADHALWTRLECDAKTGEDRPVSDAEWSALSECLGR